MSRFKPWLVRQLDIDAGIPALAPEPERGGIFLVLWSSSLPLAQVEIESARLPMDAHTLRQEVASALAPTIAGYLGVSSADGAARAGPDTSPRARWQHLLATDDGPLHRVLDRVRSPSQGRAPTVSVVVCTSQERALQLERCLDSLSRLSRPPEQVLVVDRSPTSSATEQLVARRRGIDYARANGPGLDRARNAGVRASTGEVIAYVGDDVVVHDNWLERIQRGFGDASVMAVTGRVLPTELASEAQYLFEKRWGNHRDYAPRLFDRAFYERARRRTLPVWQIGNGANMAIRRRAFELLGGFDDRLDGVAGQSEFWYRILAAGWSCRYEPSAVVFHAPCREMNELARRLQAQMCDHVAALLVQRARYGDRANLRRLLAGLPKYYARSAIGALESRERARVSALGAELAGYVAGLRHYIDARQHEAGAVPSFAFGRPATARTPNQLAMEHDAL